MTVSWRGTDPRGGSPVPVPSFLSVMFFFFFRGIPKIFVCWSNDNHILTYTSQTKHQPLFDESEGDVKSTETISLTPYCILVYLNLPGHFFLKFINLIIDITLHKRKFSSFYYLFMYCYFYPEKFFSMCFYFWIELFITTIKFFWNTLGL